MVNGHIHLIKCTIAPDTESITQPLIIEQFPLIQSQAEKMRRCTLETISA